MDYFKYSVYLIKNIIIWLWKAFYTKVPSFLFNPVPDAVKTLKFDDILDTSILVLWSPPERVNGILKGF